MNSPMTIEFVFLDGLGGSAAALAVVTLLSMLFRQSYAAENDCAIGDLATERHILGWRAIQVLSFRPAGAINA